MELDESTEPVNPVNPKCCNQDPCIHKVAPELFKHDPVNHPSHYTSHPSGIECIQITRHMGFNLGNAFKYIWRADLKNGLEDLKKAKWYIDDEIAKREKTFKRE